MFATFVWVFFVVLSSTNFFLSFLISATLHEKELLLICWRYVFSLNKMKISGLHLMVYLHGRGLLEASWTLKLMNNGDQKKLSVLLKAYFGGASICFNTERQITSQEETGCWEWPVVSFVTRWDNRIEENVKVGSLIVAQIVYLSVLAVYRALLSFNNIAVFCSLSPSHHCLCFHVNFIRFTTYHVLNQ